MRVLQNGQVLSDIEGWDRGLQFGDGVFETIRVHNGKPVASQYHAARLDGSLSRLGIQYDTPAVQLIERCAEKLSQKETGVLKIIVTRGDSARGYKITCAISANYVAFFSPLPQFSDDYYIKGISVGICQTQAAIQPQLAGLKHLNRLDNVLAAQELSVNHKEWQEGLMMNHLGHVIEGTMSNVFMLINDEWVTPKLDCSGVAGTMRQRILEKTLPAKVRDIREQELSDMKAMFICNSVIGIWPVCSFNGQVLSIPDRVHSIISDWQSAAF